MGATSSNGISSQEFMHLLSDLAQGFGLPKETLFKVQQFVQTETNTLANISESEAEQIYSNTRLTIPFNDEPTISSPGAVDVMRERYRQSAQEGFSAAHDEQYQSGQHPLMLAGMAYLEHAMHFCGADQELYKMQPSPTYWPFPAIWWKPKSPRQDLVRSAALIVAAIDSIDKKK